MLYPLIGYAMPINDTLLIDLNNIKPSVDGVKSRDEIDTQLEALKRLWMTQDPNLFRTTVLQNAKAFVGNEDAFNDAENNDDFLTVSQADIKRLAQAAAAAYVRLKLTYENKEHLNQFSNIDYEGILDYLEELKDSPFCNEDGGLFEPFLDDEGVESIQQEAKRLVKLRGSFGQSFLSSLAKIRSLKEILNQLLTKIKGSDPANASLGEVIQDAASTYNNIVAEGDKVHQLILQAYWLPNNGDRAEAELKAALGNLKEEIRASLDDEGVVKLNAVYQNKTQSIHALPMQRSDIKTRWVGAKAHLNVCKNIETLIEDRIENLENTRQRTIFSTNRLQMSLSLSNITGIKNELDGLTGTSHPEGSNEDMEARQSNLEKAQKKLIELNEHLETAKAAVETLRPMCSAASQATLDEHIATAQQEADEAQNFEDTIKKRVLSNFLLEKIVHQAHIGSLVKFSDHVVRKGGAVPVAAALADAAPIDAPVVLDANRLHKSFPIKYEGVYLNRGDSIVSIATFPEVLPQPASAGQPPVLHQPAKEGRIEKDDMGRVTDRTLATANLTPEQKSLMALKQARMMLDGYKLEDGPIMIRGKDAEQANRVCAALLNINKNLQIESYVPKCEVPTKGWFNSTADIDQYIEDHLGKLPSTLVQKESLSVGKFYNVAQAKRKELTKMKVEKRAEACLKVGEVQTIDEDKLVKLGP